VRARAFACVLLFLLLIKERNLIELEKKVIHVFTFRGRTRIRRRRRRRDNNVFARRRNRGRRGGALFSRTNERLFLRRHLSLSSFQHNKSQSLSLKSFLFSAVLTHTGRASLARFHHRRRDSRRTVIVRAHFVPKLLPVRFFRPPVRLGRVRVLLFFFVVVFPGRRRHRRRREKRQSRRRIRL